MPRLLITGASGLLGQHIARLALAAGWAVVGTYRTRPLTLSIEWHELNVADRDTVARLVDRVHPSAIVHTAYIQRGPTLWDVTAAGAAQVALAAARVGARLVHVSSDMVFAGTSAPYSEAARPDPLGAYGAAKAAAETAVAAILPAAAIVRTSLIISQEPLDQHQALVLNTLDGRQSVRFFTDEIRCPVVVDDLAAAILEIADQPFGGPLNIAGDSAVSRFALARMVARAHGRDVTAVPAGSLAESGLHRPPDLRLDLTLARARLITRLRGVDEYLGQRGGP
ncbi:MAG: sugar nucleotide-binding protein [Chloroflexi bacterium]|nr:sugar nucleotide-binding protein [Chloroflexota bacterium]